LLEAADLRVVVVSPLAREPYFHEEFAARGVAVEPLPKTRGGFLERRLKDLRFYLWSERELTSTFRIKRKTEFSPWGVWWRDLVARRLRGLGITEDRIGRWELAIFRAPKISRLYDEYRPDAILFTKLFSTNIHMVKEAKRRGVKTICFLEAWDNLTSKGPLAVVPDILLVWNQFMKQEAVEYHGFPPDRVRVVGIPQFDVYHDPNKFLSRKDFFERYGLDPSRKLLTYAVAAGEIAPTDPDVIEMLYQAVISGRVTTPAQILIRLHPQTRGRHLEKFNRFRGRPGIAIQPAGRVARIQDGWDPSWDDMIRLSETMYHSNVVLNVGSTISLDAIAFDTPVVAIGFEGDGQRDYFESYRRYYDYTHLKRIVESGGLRIAQSFDEMLHAVNRYLKDPSLDARGRERVRAEQFCFLDGRSGRRSARAILTELDLAPAADFPHAQAGRPEQPSRS
ncbi:MAG: hypothetical protein A3C54_08430, partial [Deltaproteobacteria bacterium RIFCSPHIGHO2_02_FULL_60_17]